ncbi:hypothetical protein BU24DRAFT_449330 [Aaosphaeria arxii CBS 175.79]|uniref:Uncharacterized protein n=1 Tax=Aaosphaeria arxii CBS 175.79 TaxID=1450172 RepID=A0A6A5XXN7_9PLEO|nr:uncharacterized protein BU24DRAFT_449330 [Aaosphaeria arxii CBS 175.79]KAF2017716.1 hypothetical protein BU24DRAFT_449330 [Aaosphaeria arxii CBS 175.79]
MAPISPPPSPSARQHHHHHIIPPSRLRKRDRLRPAVILLAVLSILWTGNRLRTAAAAGEGGMYAYPLRGGGEVNSFVGGGAVLPHVASGAGLGDELVEGKGGDEEGEKKKVGESVWGTHGVVGGWLFKPKEKDTGTGKTTTTNETGGEGKKGGVLGSLWREHVAVKEDKDDGGTLGSIAAVEPATPDAKDGGSSGEKTEYISPSLAEQFAQEKEMYMDASRVSHDGGDGRTPPLPVPVQAGLAVPAADQDTTASLPAPEHKQALQDDYDNDAVALLPQKIPETALKPPVESGLEPLPLPLPTPSRNDQLTTPAAGLEPSTNPAAADQHATWEEGVGQEADANADADADANAAARVSDSKQQHHGGAMLGAMNMGSMGLSGGFRRS